MNETPGSAAITVNEDVDREAEEAKVEDVVLEDDDCGLGVNAKTRGFLLTVEGRQDVA